MCIIQKKEIKIHEWIIFTFFVTIKSAGIFNEASNEKSISEKPGGAELACFKCW